MEIISRKYKDIEILFSKDLDNSLYINATQISKHFNKVPKDWLRTKDTQDYIKAVSQRADMPYGDLVVARKGGNDKSLTGTWIHNKLIISFARWLSPDFAVWSDMTIEDILKESFLTYKSEKQTNLISVSTEIMRKEIELLEFAFKNFKMSENEKRILTNKVFEKLNFPTLETKPQRKAEPVFTLTDLLSEFGISFSPYEMNLKFQSFGILQKVSGYWFLKNLKFGVNENYENYKNPKYYKSTFQELLDIVL